MSILVPKPAESQGQGVPGLLPEARKGLTKRAEGEPPRDNMGVERQGEADEVTLRPDHLGVTFPEEWGVSEMQGWISRGEEWEVLPHGSRGYTNCAQWGLIRCSWGGSRGIHIEASGKACRQLESVENFTWHNFFAICNGFGGAFSRLDWAFDEVAGLIDLEVMHEACNSGALVCRAKEGYRTVNYTSFGKQSRGQTIYLGAPSSDTRIRAYDKAAERKVDGHWTRVEMQLRRRRADASVQAFLKGGPAAIAGMLRAAVEFKQVTGLSRVKNEPIAEWWARFLGRAEVCRVVMEGSVKTLCEVHQWVKRALAPSLGLLSFLLDDLGGELEQIARAGIERFTAKHRAVLDASGVASSRFRTQPLITSSP